MQFVQIIVLGIIVVLLGMVVALVRQNKRIAKLDDAYRGSLANIANIVGSLSDTQDEMLIDIAKLKDSSITSETFGLDEVERKQKEDEEEKIGKWIENIATYNPFHGGN